LWLVKQTILDAQKNISPAKPETNEAKTNKKIVNAFEIKKNDKEQSKKKEVVKEKKPKSIFAKVKEFATKKSK